MATLYVDTSGASRLYDANEANGSAINGSFTNWAKTDEFILCVQVAEDGCNKAASTTTLRIQYSEDGGTFTDVGASTAIAYGSGTTLVNGGTTVNRCGTHSCGGTFTGTSAELEGTASVSLSLASDTFTEIHIALDPTLATTSGVYTFRVYSTTENTPLLGTISSSVTISSAIEGTPSHSPSHGTPSSSPSTSPEGSESVFHWTGSWSQATNDISDRLVLGAADLTGTLSTRIAIRFAWTGTPYTINGMGIYIQASSGDVWDGDSATFQEIKVNGTSPFTISAADTLSDPVPFIIDGTKNIVITIEHDSQWPYTSGSTPTNSDRYYDQTPTGEWNVANVSGYSGPDTNWPTVESIEGITDGFSPSEGTPSPSDFTPSHSPSHGTPSEGTPSHSPSEGTASEGTPSEGTPSPSPSEGSPSIFPEHLVRTVQVGVTGSGATGSLLFKYLNIDDKSIGDLPIFEGSPSEGTPSPSEGTASSSPSTGTPSLSPTESTPSTSPVEGTPSAPLTNVLFDVGPTDRNMEVAASEFRLIIYHNTLLVSSDTIQLKFLYYFTEWTISSIYIWEQDPNGDHEYDGKPGTGVEITQGGTSGITVNSSTRYSDIINFPVNTETNYIIAITRNSIIPPATVDNPTGTNSWNKAGNVPEAHVANVTGYSNNIWTCVEQILGVDESSPSEATPSDTPSHSPSHGTPSDATPSSSLVWSDLFNNPNTFSFFGTVKRSARLVIPATALSGFSSQIRLNFAHIGTDYYLSDVWVWKQDAEFDAYDGYPGTGIQVTNNGNTTWTVTSSSTQSDLVDISVDGTQDVLVIAFWISDAWLYTSDIPSFCTCYYKETTTSESSTANVSSYSQDISHWYYLESIEGFDSSPSISPSISPSDSPSEGTPSDSPSSSPSAATPSSSPSAGSTTYPLQKLYTPASYTAGNQTYAHTYRSRHDLAALNHDRVSSRVRVWLPPAISATSWNYIRMYVGICASDDLDFTTTPVQIFMNGNETGNSGRYGNWTDWVDLTLAPTDDLVISMYVDLTESSEVPRLLPSSDSVLVSCGYYQANNYVDDINWTPDDYGSTVLNVGALGFELGVTATATPSGSPSAPTPSGTPSSSGIWTETLFSDLSSWVPDVFGNVGYRSVVDSSQITGHSSRIKIKFGQGVDIEYTIKEAWIYKQAASGSAYTGIAGSGVQITFDNGNASTLITNSSRTSDVIDFTVEDSSSYIIAVDALDASAYQHTAPTNCVTWKCAYLGDASLADPPSAEYWERSQWYFIESITGLADSSPSEGTPSPSEGTPSPSIVHSPSVGTTSSSPSAATGSSTPSSSPSQGSTSTSPSEGTPSGSGDTSTSFTYTPTGYNDGVLGTYRSEHVVRLLTHYTIKRIRIWLPTYNSVSWSYDELFVGRADSVSAGTGFDYDSTSTEVLQSGTSGGTSGTAGAWTDWVDFNLASGDITRKDAFVISCYFSTSTDGVPKVIKSTTESDWPFQYTMGRVGDYADSLGSWNPTFASLTYYACLGYEVEYDYEAPSISPSEETPSSSPASDFLLKTTKYISVGAQIPRDYKRHARVNFDLDHPNIGITDTTKRIRLWVPPCGLGPVAYERIIVGASDWDCDFIANPAGHQITQKNQRVITSGINGSWTDWLDIALEPTHLMCISMNQYFGPHATVSNPGPEVSDTFYKQDVWYNNAGSFTHDADTSSYWGAFGFQIEYGGGGRGTPSGSPSVGTPSSSPGTSPSEATPSSSPSETTPSEGTGSSSPSEGTPSPSEGTPSDSPSDTPSQGTPSPSESTPSSSPSASPGLDYPLVYNRLGALPPGWTQVGTPTYFDEARTIFHVNTYVRSNTQLPFTDELYVGIVLNDIYLKSVSANAPILYIRASNDMLLGQFGYSNGNLYIMHGTVHDTNTTIASDTYQYFWIRFRSIVSSDDGVFRVWHNNTGLVQDANLILEVIDGNGDE